ncbi:GlxA family transcriptional regulator [Chondromyces crocatus]|uniref:AraC family transcriptional regulator n=1 Tax=Chondromyces crocatus TaxID=52 RepID=A0A0K1EKT2_CHOCO|nr:helix-turn-helix domain-containing protein [Chondromyces crocatus]AKT41446.1 AraC family transcriptional regulator [Chondromyces crocatus]
MVKRATGATVGVLAYPGAQQAAVHGLVDLFETATRLGAEMSETKGGPGIVASVLRVDGRRKVAEPPEGPLDAILLPPSLGSDGAEIAKLTALASWLVERHEDGTTLCSVCAGAFLLGATGCLEGRRATTHWALGARLAECFPEVQVDTQEILIDDGDIVTAGGVMAWIDLGLHLVGRYLGPSTLLATARYWVVDPGGREQRFYDTFAPVMTHGDEAIVRVQHWLHARRAEKIDVAAMAQQAKLTERTFVRRFQRATGHAPGTYLQLLRVESARHLLERSPHSFDEIAWRLGYGDPGAFRRIFVNVMGLTPGEYRRRFGLGTFR